MVKKDRDISPQQALLYTGAVSSAACGLSSLMQDGNPIEKIYSKVEGTTSESVGRKLHHWNALNQAGLTALQCLAAHEKPSVKTMATFGSMYVASGALTSVHTCHDKAIKAETGTILALSQLALGGAMIGRAVWMHRHKNDVDKVKV